ncbi:non-ribosomal peptide synthetase, partial [Corallococcus llansteffanensis]|uniref:non-ribosomal peptide synthetase n=1 Tax=Corallococcus llansteffanensis TaxID=2316731 RepID=UPI0011C374E9
MTPSPEGAPDFDSVRVALKQRLPDYMVPSFFILLDAFPVMPNGKLDRKALPAPDTSQSTAYVAPRTDVEQKLATLWSEVLRVPRVGLSDDFFALGGHSLLATQLVSRIRATFSVELPLRALFEASTLEAFAARLQAALQSSATTTLPPLVPTEKNGPRPLSFSQQRLWFLHQLEPDNAAYNLPAALRLSGDLDVELLRRTFEFLEHRHESLRTTFTVAQGEPIQLIHPPAAWKLEVEDLTSLPAEQRQTEAVRLASQEARSPFHLEAGPLIRVRLLKLASDEHVLLVNMHHAISDGWSIGVLIREVSAAYGALASGQSPSLPPLPLQYTDYAVWQRAWLQGAVLEQQLDYWRRQLGDAPVALDLPTDRPRPPVQTFRGTNAPVRLPLHLSEQLKALARREETTPFMLLLAAFQLLLHRYTGQDDLLVGSPIAGRTHAETESLIGFFVNMLVLRARIDSSESFLQLLQQVKATTLGAYEHQHLPFEKLVEELQPQRDLSRPPLFQAMFALQNQDSGGTVPQLGNLAVQPLKISGSASRVELSMGLAETPEGFSGILEYNTDLFDEATILRFIGHFQVLLQALAQQPQRALASLPILTEDERRQVLVDFNDVRADFPRDVCIHDLISAQACQTPDAPALRFQDFQLSYRELEERANRLANYLRSLGVGPEVRVALLFERSPHSIISLLATLKAGGAYVPLDPTYPPERLAFMVEDAAPRVLLTQPAVSSLSSSLAHLIPHTVDLDSDSTQARVAAFPSLPPPPLAGPDSLAYIIYTSGSTGRPKGTLIAHRGLCNTALACIRSLGVGPSSRVLQYSAPGFDISVWETFQALVSGACLVLAPREQLLPDAPLRSLIDSQQITHLTATPSVLTQLEPHGMPSLRTVVSGGEACTPELVRKWSQGRTLFNGYGPTEITVCATITPGSARPERLTIGQPLTNTQTYVLDSHLQPVPVGVPGELFVGGVGVARGYLHRPELTAQFFIPHPLSSSPGERLYRTGDRVRWLPEGELEFLGRIDSQVKLRGFRVELGEVEAALCELPGIQDVSALVREDSPGDKRLVAYVTPSPEGAPDFDSVRVALKQRLPDYMVPSFFILLDAFPVMPNGKLDRKALPAPDTSQSTAYVAPRTDVEQKLAALWNEVLRVPRVGLSDDFFALGGHSLLATQLVSRIRATFSVELPLRTLFEASTLEAFAARLQATLQSSATTTLPPLVPTEKNGPRPLSFSQQRLWFLHQLEPDNAAYNLPVALSLSGHLDVEALRRTFEFLVHRHESLRTTFGSEADLPIQLIHPPAAWKLEVEDLTSLPAEQRQAEALRLVSQEARSPFHLETGPLFRARLLRLDATEHVLLANMHHAISDAWSIGVMVREVAATYEALALGQSPSLAPLSLQYTDYAVWQRGWLQGAVLQQQLGYWRQQLSGAPAALELPTDRPRPSAQSRRGASLPLQLSQALTGSLKALAQREGVTPFMLLLAAFQSLLHRYSGQDDVLVGSPIAGRRHAELEGLIGFFVNTLVLRARMDANPSFRALLRQVKETTLGAYAHQDIPFEKLVEELKPRRDLGRTPLFQVMFALQNTPASELALPQLTLRPLSVEGHSAKFDLSLHMAEGPEGFTGTLVYSTDLFEPATAARMMAHLQVLLEGALASPDAPLAALPLLRQDERHQLLVQWNDTASAFQGDDCLHHLFEAQVLRTPDAPAVVFEGACLSFHQLNARSNQLAWHLRSLGVGPDVPVGLYLERSVDSL